jgi:exo-1,4-beta-D-glucosaminidase
LPEIKNLTPVYFLDLRIFNAENKEVDNSIYWLSTKKDVLDYEASKKLSWAFYTPTKSFADFKALDKLPKVNLEYKYNYSKDDQFGIVSLTIKNPSKAIAFFNYLDVIDPQTKQPILPIYWDDNYVTILPGEERNYEAKFFLSDFKGEKPVLEVRGWNVEKVTVN